VNRDGFIAWWENPVRCTDALGCTSWTKHLLSEDFVGATSVYAADMDGDGDLDILASDRKGTRRGVFWLEHPGFRAIAAGVVWREHPIGGSDREVMFLTRGDLDREGMPEIVAAVRGGGLMVFRCSGDPKDDQWESFEVSLPNGVGTGKGIAIGDIDRDGQQDLVFSCENASGEKSGVRWLSYASSMRDPVWQDHEISGSEGVKFDLVELVDLEGDGDLDVLTCEEIANLGVIWYENPSVGER
jgi:hypothetical protein